MFECHSLALSVTGACIGGGCEVCAMRWRDVSLRSFIWNGSEAFRLRDARDELCVSVIDDCVGCAGDASTSQCAVVTVC